MLNQNPVVLADKRTTPCRRRNSWHSCFNPKQLVAPQAEDQLLLPPAQPSPLANEGINGSGLRAPPRLCGDTATCARSGGKRRTFDRLPQRF